MVATTTTIAFATTAASDIPASFNVTGGYGHYKAEELPALPEIAPAHGSMIYVDTIKQAKIRNGTDGSLWRKLEDLGERMYWCYYIHLPFYLMTSFDSFCLHSFFLIVLTLGMFAFVKYFLLA